MLTKTVYMRTVHEGLGVLDSKEKCVSAAWTPFENGNQNVWVQRQGVC